MKIKSIFGGIDLKVLWTISCFVFGISSLSECSAQSSVVGKWKEMSVKQFYSPEYAKQIGKAFIEGGAPPGSGYHWEFKADHTYIIESGDGNGKSSTSTGEWSVSGNQLTMRADAQVRKGLGGQIYTFVITGNKMTRTQIMLAPYNEMVIKQEDTSERM
jgi:Lipocalin-like domain